MSQRELDVSHLLNYTSDAAFVSACYQTLLERPINPEEVFFAVQMMNQGLSKKGFIYWVCHSQEFGKRYTVKNLSTYCLPCYFYKGCEKLKNILHLRPTSRLRVNSLLPRDRTSESGFALLDFSRDCYHFETEYSALSCGQISLIPSVIQSAVLEERWSICGHLASGLMPPDSCFSSIEPSKFLKDISACEENLFVTSPEVVYQLLTDKSLCSLTNYVKGSFIFTMPALSSSSDGVSIVWDFAWNKYDTRKNCYFRWIKSAYNQSGLLLINHHTNYQKVSVSFSLMCPHRGTLIQMKYGDSLTEISIKNVSTEVTLELWLNPGCNKVCFRYLSGSSLSPDDSIDTTKFGISDLRLSFFENPQNRICGLKAYESCEDEQGTGFYPYILPESLIRSKLHQNGFYEVHAHCVSSTYAVQKLGTTRYFYAGDDIHRSCYYPVENNSSDQPGDQYSSVTVYIARRTATLMRDSFFLNKDNSR